MERDINKEAKIQVPSQNWDNRIKQQRKIESFIKLKYYKYNFLHKPTCRLINPTKPTLEK